MAGDRPILAMIGHGTDGSDGIEQGIHLRWAFRKEVGFPPGGFCLYRRTAQSRPMNCIDFGRKAVGILGESFYLMHRGTKISVSSDQTIRAVEKHLSLSVDSLPLLTRYAVLPPTPGKGTVIHSSAPIRINLPAPVPVVVIEVGAQPRTTIVLIARSGTTVRQRRKVGARADGIVAVELTGAAIDSVEIEGHDVFVYRVCFPVAEPCDDMKGWEPVTDCPLCLPITNSRYGCIHGHPGCDDREAKDRLPDDPCIRDKYSGSNLSDLLDTLKVLVDPGKGVTMGSRTLAYPTEPTDCPPPGTDTPEIRISALDLLLISSIDPNIARMLGLYFVDRSTPVGERYDYKIMGTWPAGTLWNLAHSVDFEGRMPDEPVLPGFEQNGVSFVANCRGRIARVTTNIAKTQQAVSLQTDEGVGWVPFGLGPAIPPLAWLRIGFPAPVGEVQLYVRQGGAGLHASALRNEAEVGSADATQLEEVLALHAPEIDSVVLTGDLRLLYQVRYDESFFPFGEQCAISYGLEVSVPRPLDAPRGLIGVALPGATQKENDCEPLLEGALDTRFPTGVRWDWPDPVGSGLLSIDPILFHVERGNPDGTSELRTEGRPTMVVPLPPDQPYTPPSGWPAERPYFLDMVPAPGAYKYRAAGIDIFGRESDFGSWSLPVDVKPPPPPPPANLVAKYLDPTDPFLAQEDRDWLSPENLPGLLLSWDWLPAQERQAPRNDAFRIFMEDGWLNILIGKVVADPTDADPSFTLPVAFEVPIPPRTLAGTTMTLGGVPYQIQANTGSVSGGPPYTPSLTIGKPHSGMPAGVVGHHVSVPLIPVVRGRVDSFVVNPDRSVGFQLRIQGLRAVPEGGFVGGFLIAGDAKRMIVWSDVPTVQSDGLHIVVRTGPVGDWGALPALRGNQVGIALPPPPSLYRDYRIPSSWSVQLAAAPCEGTGTYGVFIRPTAAAPEIPGRSSVGPRKSKILTTIAIASPNAIQFAQVGVSTKVGTEEGSVSPPATFLRVTKTLPPVPAMEPADDIARVYASLPDYHGNASYPLRWVRQAGYRYMVYRSMDETIFDVDRLVAPSRSTTRSDWDPFLDQFPGLENAIFTTFIQRPAAPDYAGLSNRLLQALASFPDIVDAFAPLTKDAIDWDDSAHEDRANEVAGPGEVAYSPDPTKRLYVDRTIPGEGSNRYFYRLRAVDPQGNRAPLGISTPPVYLRYQAPPRAPVVAAVQAGDREITLTWTSNREANLAKYRVFRTDNSVSAGDISAMVAIHDEAVPGGDPRARPKEVSWTDTPIRALTSFYYRITAIDSGGKQSEPSRLAIGRAFRASPPDPPSWTSAVRVAAGGNTIIRLAWTESESLETYIQRRPRGSLVWFALSDWTPRGILTYDDATADPATAYLYRLKARDATLVQSNFSDEAEVPSSA